MLSHGYKRLTVGWCKNWYDAYQRHDRPPGLLFPVPVPVSVLVPNGLDDEVRFITAFTRYDPLAGHLIGHVPPPAEVCPVPVVTSACVGFSPLTPEALDDARKREVCVMWHPEHRLDWDLSDPFEPLEIVTVTRNSDTIWLVQTQGMFSGRTHYRKITNKGQLPISSAGMPSAPAPYNSRTTYSGFVAATAGDCLDWVTYANAMFVRRGLGWDWIPAAVNMWSASVVVRQACKWFDLVVTDDKDLPIQGKAKIQTNEKEKSMSSTSVSLIGVLKADITKAIEHGGKVAAGCAVADLVVKRVRAALGDHYPRFFLDHPVGRVLEPIALCSAVLAVGYAIQLHGGAKLPCQDVVMDGARYALEGKVRDSVGVVIGPVTELFSKLGAELKATETVSG